MERLHASRTTKRQSHRTLEIDKRADVYSFGILVCELTQRRHPWWSSELGRRLTGAEIRAAVGAGKRPEVPEALRQTAGRLVAIMERCWAQDPLQRPDFTEINNDLS